MARPDSSKIQQALFDASLPVTNVWVSAGVVNDVYSRALNPTERSQANAIIADPMNAQRRPRSLHEIYLAVNALSAPNKVAIWTDLTSGTPHKFTLDEGPNAGSILVLQWAVESSGTDPTSIQEAQLRLIILYVQDNPKYLVHPPFAPSINIPGDEAVP